MPTGSYHRGTEDTEKSIFFVCRWLLNYEIMRTDRSSRFAGDTPPYNARGDRSILERFKNQPTANEKQPC